jgi:hypothetical protein
MAATILRGRIDRKIEDVLGEEKFEFRRGKGTGDANGKLRITVERTLDTNEELCTCLIDWQKVSDCDNCCS